MASDFKENFRLLILSCISSTYVAVSWNGELLPPFLPSRELKLGDLLSPYLFVMCMEALAQEISTSVLARNWWLDKVAKEGPRVSHIFFADDLLLFEEASFSQARKMGHVLASFCGILGQRVHRHMSRIWFSPNTPSYLKNVVSFEFGIPTTLDLGMYLGGPLMHWRLWTK